MIIVWKLTNDSNRPEKGENPQLERVGRHVTRLALGELCLIRSILGIPCRIFHDLDIKIRLYSSQFASVTYVAQNHRQNYHVVIAHPNIALEWLVLRSQKFCPRQQLCLAQGFNRLVKNHVQSDPDL